MPTYSSMRRLNFRRSLLRFFLFGALRAILLLPVRNCHSIKKERQKLWKYERKYTARTIVFMSVFNCVCEILKYFCAKKWRKFWAIFNRFIYWWLIFYYKFQMVRIFQRRLFRCFLSNMLNPFQIQVFGGDLPVL